jgi:hypothetical protein
MLVAGAAFDRIGARRICLVLIVAVIHDPSP